MFNLIFFDFYLNSINLFRKYYQINNLSLIKRAKRLLLKIRKFFYKRIKLIKAYPTMVIECVFQSSLFFGLIN